MMKLFALLAALCVPVLADDITGLHFISGSWKGTLNTSHVEEHWMAPQGDATVGMYRVIRDGKTRMTELCVMEQRPEGIVLFLRHFSPGLVAREEKDSPNRFTLEKLEPNRATFLQDSAPTRLIYERVDEDRLVITLVKVQDGKESRTPFEYRRISGAGAGSR